jgi:hypothetical protein
MSSVILQNQNCQLNSKYDYRLSCLGGSIFLQVLVFAGILQHGYFMAVEQDPEILAAEVALTGFAVVYFVYVYLRLIRTVA